MLSYVSSLALFATSVSALGSAAVVNNCPYDVSLSAVPAQNGGFSETNEVLSTGQSWSSTWTQLTNLAGWSIKLAKGDDWSNIMQYEYTYQLQTADMIWYDLSDVNGNPWDGDWEVTSDTPGCNPKDQAYRYATDDAYGMQTCPSSATITVTLCSGSDSSASSGSSTSSGSSASSAAPAPSTSAAPAPAPSPSSSSVAPVVPLTTVAAPSISSPAASSMQGNLIGVDQVDSPASSASSASSASPSQQAPTSSVVANKAAVTSAVHTSEAPVTSVFSSEAPVVSVHTSEAPAAGTDPSVVIVHTTVVVTAGVAATTTAEPVTVAAASVTTTSAAPPAAWNGPWTHWGLAADGAVVAEADGVLKREATTFATVVSAAETETPSATALAGRSHGHHEHGAHRHRHHHAI